MSSKPQTPIKQTEYNTSFLSHLEEFNRFLVEILEKNALITLSLKELSTLQSVKALLDKVHYLNLVYQENSRIKKYFIQRNNENKALEEKLYDNIDIKIKSFIHDLDKNMDKLRIQLVNRDLNQKTAVEFIRKLCNVTLKSKDFLIIGKENKEDFSYFSTIESFMNKVADENFHNCLFEGTFEEIKKLNSSKIVVEITNIQDFFLNILREKKNSKEDIEMYENLVKTNFQPTNTLLLQLVEKDKKMLIFFLNIESEKSSEIIKNNYYFKKYRLLYQNVDEDSFRKIGGLLKSMVMNIQNDVFSKVHMCKILDDIKHSLVLNAKDICREILKNELSVFLNTSVEIIKKNSKNFVYYYNELSGDIYDIKIDKKKIIIPIIEFEEVGFYLSIENFTLDIHTFIDRISKKWGYVNHMLQSIKERHVFTQILENENSKLIFLFNNDLELLYQNREIPTNLRNHLEINEFLNKETPKLAEIFIKDSNLLLNMSKNIENFKHSNERFISNNSTPSYEIVVKRNDFQDIDYFLILLKNQKNLILEKSQINSNKEKQIKPLDERKIQKYVLYLLRYCHVDYPLTSMDVCDLLIEKSRELQIKNMNPLKTYSDNASELSLISDYSNIREIDSPNFVFKRRTKEKKMSHVISNTEAIKGPRKTKKNSFSKSSIFKKDGMLHGSDCKKSEEELKLNNLEIIDSDLEKLNDWNFNILEIHIEADKLSLLWQIFQSLNFLEKFEIETPTFLNFLEALHEKYNQKNNPFHNFDHAFTVCQGSYYLIRSKILHKYLIDSELFSLLFGALCHDADHTGKTNAFEAASYSGLALKYNDESILESHHSAITFKLVHDKRFNIFANLPDGTYKYIRKMVISNILYTDMKRHFESLNAFEVKQKEFMEQPDSLFKNESGKKLISGIVIHAADLYSSTKRFPIAKSWSIKINQEFSTQVKEEIKMGLPPTPYMMDLDKPEIMAKQEISFIKFIQKPLWESVNRFLEGYMSPALEDVEKNIKEWEKLLLK